MPTKKKPAKKSAKKKLNTPSYKDATYQKQESYFNKLLGDFLANQTREKTKVATYFGTEGSPEKKAVTKDVKTAATRKVAKSLKELKTERKPIRKAEYKRLVAADKGKLTAKDIAKYKEMAKAHGRSKVALEKTVPVLEQVARNLKDIQAERKTVRKKRYQRLVKQYKVEGMSPQEKAYAKEQAKAFARKKVATTKGVQKYNTTKKTITPAQAAQAPTEGLYQRELRESRAKDLKNISSSYAGRGLLRSGLYAQKTADYEGEFNKQLAEMARQRSEQYGDISQRYQGFQREQELQREQARQQALQRAQARYTPTYGA